MARRKEDNLIPQAHKLTVEEASRGGKASVEARRQKKLFKEYAEELLNKPAVVDGKDSTRKDWIMAKAIGILVNENTSVRDFWKGLEILRDTLGELPMQSIQMEVTNQNALRDVLSQIKTDNEKKK